MIASITIAAALALVAPVPQGQEPAVQVQSAVTLTPIDADADAAVSIGQPLRLTVTLDGAAASGATLDEDFELGPAWSAIAGPRSVVDAGLAPYDRPAVQLEWTVMALESGTVATPPFLFQLSNQTELAVAPATIEVTPALLEGEDVPRPLVEFRDVEDRAIGDPRVALAVLLGIAALPLAWLLVRRTRRRSAKPGTTPEPSARELIDALDPSVDPVGAMSALGPLVRRAIDAARDSDLAGCTDAEWAEDLESATGPFASERRALSVLVRELSVVRFGGAAPTTFAAKEAIARARELVDALEGRPDTNAAREAVA